MISQTDALKLKKLADEANATGQFPEIFDNMPFYDQFPIDDRIVFVMVEPTDYDCLFVADFARYIDGEFYLEGSESPTEVMGWSYINENVDA